MRDIHLGKEKEYFEKIKSCGNKKFRNSQKFKVTAQNEKKSQHFLPATFCTLKICGIR